jgi:hypothetical protein
LEELESYSKAPGFVGFLVVVSLSCFFLMMTIANSEFYKMRKHLTTIFLTPVIRRIDKLSEREEALYSRMEFLDSRYSWLEKRVEQAFWLRGREKEMGVAPMTFMEEGVGSALPPHLQPDGSHFKVMRRSFSGNRSFRQGGHNGRGSVDSGRLGDDDEDDGPEYLKWVDAFSYAAVSGVCGAISILLAGLASKTLIMALQGNSQFDKPTPYIFIAGMLCTIILQTKYLNSAMQMGDIMTIYPVFQAFWIGFGVFGGMVFYQDFKDLSTTQWAIYLCAAAAMVVGCFFFFEHGRQEWSVIRNRLMNNHFKKKAESVGVCRDNGGRGDEEGGFDSLDTAAAGKSGHRYLTHNSMQATAVWPDKSETGSQQHWDTDTQSVTSHSHSAVYSDHGSGGGGSGGPNQQDVCATPSSVSGSGSSSGGHFGFGGGNDRLIQQLPPLKGVGVERGGSHLLTTPQQHSSSSSSSAAPPQVTDHISAASSSSSKAGKGKGNSSKGWGWGKSKSKSSQHGTTMQLDLPQSDGGTLLVEEDGCTIRHPEPGALLGVIQSQQPFTLAAAAASAAKQKQQRQQQCAYFEVEVLEVGCSPDTQSSGVACVAIGLAPGGYPLDCLPGWLEGSVGYHGDDGGYEHFTTIYT